LFAGEAQSVLTRWTSAEFVATRENSTTKTITSSDLCVRRIGDLAMLLPKKKVFFLVERRSRSEVTKSGSELRSSNCDFDGGLPRRRRSSTTVEEHGYSCCCLRLVRGSAVRAINGGGRQSMARTQNWECSRPSFVYRSFVRPSVRSRTCC